MPIAQSKACTNNLEKTVRRSGMAKDDKTGMTNQRLNDGEFGSGEAADRSGKGGKSGGGMGGQQAGGIKGGGKRSTHQGSKKGSPGGLTSD
jgi:hypothetical protein